MDSGCIISIILLVSADTLFTFKKESLYISANTLDPKLSIFIFIS